MMMIDIEAEDVAEQIVTKSLLWHIQNPTYLDKKTYKALVLVYNFYMPPTKHIDWRGWIQ